MAAILQTRGGGNAVNALIDEIGEVETKMQAKLLRVMQNRCFQREGDTWERPFRGKVIAATNRDLIAEMRRGRFREDFYCRLNADMVRTPTLLEQLADDPSAMGGSVRHIAAKTACEEEAEALTEEVTWVRNRLEPRCPAR